MRSTDKPSDFESYEYEKNYSSKTKNQNRILRIFFQSSSLFFATLLFLLLIYKSQALILKGTKTENHPKFVLPEPMIGLCNGSCVPNGAYPCIYSNFYPVSFTKDGKWRWDCPFVDNSGVEFGVGKIIGMPQILQNTNKDWKANWYGGNKILSDPNERVHCACYYVGGKVDEKSWLFHSFQIKIINIAKNESIENICGSFTGCPKSIEDAFEQLDADPYIEKYFGCKPN